MDKKIFSLPVSKKHQSSMRRRFIVFSFILFLLILILGSIAFVLLMGQMTLKNTGLELSKSLELERFRLEASVTNEIAIVLKMANSPLIKRYFINPNDSVIRNLAFEEIAAYRRAFAGRTVFWISDNDKIYYRNEHDFELIDTVHPDNYWYDKTLYETDEFYFNINHDLSTNITNLWINAPVFDNENKPVGIVGTGINISRVISTIYRNYSGYADLYFFNADGEITGAHNIDLIRDKVSITKELGSVGEEIMTRINTLRSDEIKYFETIDKEAVAVIGAIPALNWYLTAVHHFSLGESLQTGMTFLFTVMMIVIFSVFAVFNVFVARLLDPLYNIVNEISQLSKDWDLKHQNKNKDEIETLGEFLNMTIIDQLTGIYNRRFFDGSMKKIIRLMSRNGGRLSLLMLDIDFFKNYNDTYGHDMGDTCLASVASILSKTITREDDFVARYGGEEFVVVLPNTGESGANLIAEKLLKNIRDAKIPHEKNPAAPYVTLSIGGTTGMVNHSHEESDYVKHADAALYKSKQSGRNKYTFEKFEESET